MLVQFMRSSPKWSSNYQYAQPSISVLTVAAKSCSTCVFDLLGESDIRGGEAHQFEAAPSLYCRSRQSLSADAVLADLCALASDYGFCLSWRANAWLEGGHRQTSPECFFPVRPIQSDISRGDLGHRQLCYMLCYSRRCCFG